MAKPKFYWDSCAWLGLLNGEPEKKRELEIVYNSARKGECEIWTSTFSLVEVNRFEDEVGKAKPLEPERLIQIAKLFEQPFVKLVALDLEIARNAQKLVRETSGLRKKTDAVHLASALRWSVDALHTYDNDDLLHLDGKLLDKRGNSLRICYPDEHSDGPLFAQNKRA